MELVAKNIKWSGGGKNLSQKEVRSESVVPKGLYSRIENGKGEPYILTLEKLASVFEVPIADFIKSVDLEEEWNKPLTQKIKMIDMALSNKRIKDNLQTLIDQ